MEPQTLNNEIVKQFFIPQFILKSLECELKMKVIILFYGNSVNKTHDLEVLFNLLPEVLKNECKKICNNDIEFNVYLEEHKDAFVDFRYEKNFTNIYRINLWFLNALSDKLYNYYKEHIENIILQSLT